MYKHYQCSDFLLFQGSVCQASYFPYRLTDPSCPAWAFDYKSEAAMWEELDALEDLLPGARPALHYFRGAYSSGGNADWPIH